jgi:hypothetical protein
VTSGRARLFAVAAAVIAAVGATAAGSAAMAGGDDSNAVRGNNVHEHLTGYQEDPAVISTAGGADFRAKIDERGQTITYTLSYWGLAGNVTQSHIHFGGRAQSGGISVFLCSNLGNGPAGTQACPAAPATITGTITPADVIGPTGQGIAPGEFAELIAALRAGVTYVNVHSTTFPGGEIRAQIDH